MLGEVQADSPALQAPSSCFCPPPSPPSPLQQSFQTFSPAVPPISREFQWKIVAASSILERHSLGLDHSDQPTTLSHSLFIIFLISWNSRCCVFVFCCDGKPISRTQPEEVLEIDRIRNVWNCCAHKTQWSQSCSRGGRSWPPWPLPSPGMQGPERASRGSLGPSPPSPALPWTWTWPHLPAATAFLCQTTSKWGHMECQEMPASPPYKRCLCR